MSIQEINVPYEILYRLNEDGTVAGCHRCDLQIVKNTETGQVYNAKELDPQPIEGADMDSVLGLITTAQAATIAQQNTAIGDLNASLSTLESQKSELLDLVNRLQQEIITLNENN